MISPEQFDINVSRRKAEKDKEKQKLADKKTIRIVLEKLLDAGEITGTVGDFTNLKEILAELEEEANEQHKDSIFKYQFRLNSKWDPKCNTLSISLLPSTKMHSWIKPMMQNFIYPYWECANCQVTASAIHNGIIEFPISTGYPESGYDEHFRYDINWSKDCSRGVCK